MGEGGREERSEEEGERVRRKERDGGDKRQPSVNIEVHTDHSNPRCGEEGCKAGEGWGWRTLKVCLLNVVYPPQDSGLGVGQNGVRGLSKDSD